MQNFINRHTALAVLVLILGCFFAGYYMGEKIERGKHVVPLSAGCPAGELCI